MKETMNKTMVDYQNLLHDFHMENQHVIDFNEIKRRIADGQKVYVLGKNPEALFLKNNLKISGLVDDFSEKPSYWQGLECFNSQDLPADSLVINCSTSIAPLSAAEKIESIPHLQHMAYSELLINISHEVPLPEFVKEAKQDFSSNENKYKWVFSLLADEVSQNIFNQVMSYRLTAQANYMEGMQVRLSDQYFEPFYGTLNEKVFVDCGGFDGDTSEQLAIRYPNYKKIWMFEPSSINILKAKQRLANYKNIDYIELGVSDQAGTLYFNDAAGSASAVSDSGNSKIQVAKLDEFINERVDFIKMDLEGWERNALIGAKRLIFEHSPVLAIAVYHTISDFWKIPEYILSINPNYKIYLRHYTQGWSETVMYFVPQGN